MKNSILEFIERVFPDRATNGIYTYNDFIKALLEAAEKNKFLEGACIDLDGSCDAETIFNKLEEVDPDALYDIFIGLVKKQLIRVKIFSRNRKIDLAGDVTCDAYYGNDISIWIHGYRPKNGSTGSYQYLVISIVLNGTRLIVGALPLRTTDKVEMVLEKLLSEVKSYIPIAAILLDRGFNSARVIRMLKQLKLGYLILWKKYDWHWQVFKSMGKKKFHRLERTLTIKDDEGGGKIKVKTNMVFVKGIKIEGDKKAHNWVFATNLHKERPIHYIYSYKHRWAIETKFRVADELQIRTKTKNMGKRFFLVLFTLWLYNVWKVFRYITEIDVTFTGFASHFNKIHEEQAPKRKLKPNQRLVREQVRNICF